MTRKHPCWSIPWGPSVRIPENPSRYLLRDPAPESPIDWTVPKIVHQSKGDRNFLEILDPGSGGDTFDPSQSIGARDLLWSMPERRLRIRGGIFDLPPLLPHTPLHPLYPFPHPPHSGLPVGIPFGGPWVLWFPSARVKLFFISFSRKRATKEYVLVGPIDGCLAKFVEGLT